MNITLKCPQCGNVISAAAADGLEKRKAECPRCHTLQAVSDYLPSLCLHTDTSVHQLHFGAQWVGRQSKGSDADVQIPDPTGYMSRRHALVRVDCTAAGLRCTYEEHGKNPTAVQGIELVEGDIVYLNVNDCLMMGDTKMYLSNEFS